MFKVMQVAATPGSKQKSTANGSKWTPPGAPAMSWMTCFIFIIVKIILILIRISSQKLTPVKGCCIEILAEMGIPRCSWRSEEHTSELQSRGHLVCRLLLEKKKTTTMSCFSDIRKVGRR